MLLQILTDTIRWAAFFKRMRLLFPAVVVALPLLPSSWGQEMNKSSLSQSSIDEQCIGNLRHIYRLLKLHLHHSGGALGFPSDLDTLYGLSKDPKIFICPGDTETKASEKPDAFRTSYEIVNDPLKPELAKTPPARIAIIAEKRANHNGQRFVLFYDGSVKAFDAAQFDKLRSNSFIATEALR